MSVKPSFIFGGDTGVQTPEDLARLRAIADALARPAAPRTIGQGLNALGEAIGYRLADSKATSAERDWRKGGNDVFSALFGGGGASSPVATSESASKAVASALGGGSMGSAPDLSGNDIYNGFMDTVKSKVTNPYGLAAVAATANAESRFNPKNAFGSWSDPSESGQAGTAGGILSWRGPRFEAMRAFAGSNGGDANAPSPQLQAQYFLHEDPGLIDALNAAKSPEEAQRLMNNAWKFAGYNRPGGEAARRISMANSFASRFAGSDAAPVQVASLEP
ncbi:phage tail tip lysozyme, partial [Mesorhizobium sp.]